MIATLLLAVRRRWAEAAVLVAAVMIIYVGVAGAEGGDGRGRAPPDPLTSAGAPAFPSGHAAHSIIFPWLALTLTRPASPGMAGAPRCSSPGSRWRRSSGSRASTCGSTT